MKRLRTSCGTNRPRSGELILQDKPLNFAMGTSLLTINTNSYLIDLEDAEYNSKYADPAVWTDYEYFSWNLARKGAEGKEEW